ncbi:type II toxin-antitoxin system HipA family toxin [Pedobacter sp. MR2016-24]|uniref:type II toxin-antitoxin system HipA family toxin n=1 Tax=Pedobacter sp. MR2016-24 TaxID=2994466 RepID=UPI0022476E70|nr:HipA domain-containing protein [Pedobacter sp. MR2016-24]MCX2483150.1 HipA domain-containing protein [Pedobacter sp. MR2016-24]
MSSPEINNCPGTLAEGFDTYSQLALRRVFSGKKVSHILPYTSPDKDGKDMEQFIENRKRISISGVQEKMSLLLEKNRLRLTQDGEQGTYILKPIPRDIKHVDQVPANEHLTMQLARQVYKITTAENALIFFEDGAAAYITLRFDIRPDGGKYRKEDFASLAGMSKDTDGPDFKYHYSYEELGGLIREFVPSWRVEMEKFFKLVVFNYLFSNGDAHLKNFALLETASGDFVLSPAYDLLNTRIHVDDPHFALDGGLFADDFKSWKWKRKSGAPSGLDFIEFAKRIGIQENRIESILAPFLVRQQLVEDLISRSYLNPEQKKGYLLYYNRQRNLLK